LIRFDCRVLIEDFNQRSKIGNRQRINNQRSPNLQLID